jgi:maltokinase
VTSDLVHFLTRSRWFGGKGREFTVSEVRRVAEVPGGTEGGPRVVIDLAVVAYSDGDTDLYQLPLAFYAHRQDRLEHALIGEWDDPDFGPSYVYDAAHDRASMSLWLLAFAAASDRAADPDTPLMFHRLPGYELDAEAQPALFSGEQSNSSIAFGEDSLMKVFRRVTPGVNPDVQIHEVLTTAGSDHVAELYGWLDTVDEETDSVIQLAMLQQFLRTASDGFELAKASVRDLYAEADLHADEVGGDFAGESARLGTALAEVHESMRTSFGVGTLDPSFAADEMTARLGAALDVVPELAEYADTLRATFAQLAGLDAIEVHRIHGDLHLGQTLRTVKGWKLVDFEGEPAKPLADRLLPDSPWRDVAGMLRSFDYAPYVVERAAIEGDEQGVAQRAYRGAEWSERNRQAFVEAYAGRELTSDERTLLAAYEADKAVYEAVYETRNRPTWVPIPMAAIERLAKR